MNKIKCLVIGGNGMLGSMLVDYLSKQDDIRLMATVRTPRLRYLYETKMPDVAWKVLDADPPDKDLWNALEVINGNTWVINAIGVIKPCIDESQHESVAHAVRINSIFPCELMKRAHANESMVIQIATDCVFNGTGTDGYQESHVHDAGDVYGKTKSLGEIKGEQFHNIRCSIIGPESRKQPRSLLEWFLGQADGSTVDGYAHHFWNGVTTLHFAKVCLGIIRDKAKLPHLTHLVPADNVAKADMLTMFAEAYNKDVTVKPVTPGSQRFGVLDTEVPDLNKRLWALAGYDTPPTVSQMITELSEYDYGMKL